jgi:YgiT-type zinc finger domain-containing protein
MDKKIKCLECGESMNLETRPYDVVHKGLSASVQVKAYWCSGCGEAIFDGKALKKLESALSKLQKR